MLYTLVGLPYSGKTTLTKELVKRFGFSIVSMDDILDQKGFEVEKMTQENWNLIFSQGYEKLKNLLLEAKTVVLDLGNLKRSERKTAREIAESLGSDHKLIFLDISIDEIEARWKRNSSAKERGQLERVTLDKALSMFEKPAPDEDFVVYNQNTDLDKWIEINIDIS